jgi:hypothetical protein
MPAQWTDPTPEEATQAELVQADLIELFNRLEREGIAAPIILCGAAQAIADLVTVRFGAEHVMTWFARQAADVWKLQNGDS